MTQDGDHCENEEDVRREIADGMKSVEPHGLNGGFHITVLVESFTSDVLRNLLLTIVPLDWMWSFRETYERGVSMYILEVEP